VDALRSKLPVFPPKRTNFEAGDLYLYTTWNISGPAADQLSGEKVEVVSGQDIIWDNRIKQFCQREQITWIR
jgi:hypothetical protein